MNNPIRLLTLDETAAVAGGFDGYCGTLPLHWPRWQPLADPGEPMPWLPSAGFGGP